MFPKREILIIKQQQLLFKIIPFALLVFILYCLKIFTFINGFIRMLNFGRQEVIILKVLGLRYQIIHFYPVVLVII